MKLISWNVNGFRACLSKGFSEFFREADGDFVCLQETKMHGTGGLPPGRLLRILQQRGKEGLLRHRYFCP